MPDPSSLKDMEKAAPLAGGIAAGAIGIFGDYDVDGATSRRCCIVSSKRPVAKFSLRSRPHQGLWPNLPALLAFKKGHQSCGDG